MNPDEYTILEKADIEERVKKAVKMLEELKLRPTSSVSSVNIGNDVFAQKVFVYLQDTKYEHKLSPIQP